MKIKKSELINIIASEVVNKILAVKKYTPKNKKELKKLIYDDKVDLATIDTSNIKDMSYLFDEGFKVNNFKGIEKWNVSNVVNMNYLFSYCKSKELNLSKWNTSKVKTMSSMFSNCNINVLKISNWDISSVTDMSFMFSNSKIQNINLSKWNVKKVRSFLSMFEDFKSTIDLSKWELSNRSDIRSMFVNVKENNVILPNSLKSDIQKDNAIINNKIKELFKKINSEFKANKVAVPSTLSSLNKEYSDRYDFYKVTNKIESIISKSLGQKSKKLLSIVDNMLMSMDDIKNTKYKLFN